MQAVNNRINGKGIILLIGLLAGLIISVEFFDKTWLEGILESERIKKYLIGYGVIGAICSSFFKSNNVNLEFDFSFFCDLIINILTYIAVIASSFTLLKATCFQLLGKELYFSNIQNLDVSVIAIVSCTLLVKFLIDATKNIKDLIQIKSSAEVSPVPDRS